MSSSKGTKYLDQLSHAIANESVALIPELSRKLRKHAPDRTALALGAEAEALIISTIDAHSRRNDQQNFNASGTTRWGWIKPPLNEMTGALQLLAEADASEGTPQDRQYVYGVRIIARNLIGYHLAAIELGSTLQPRLQDPHSAKYLAMIGVAQEALGRDRDALATYSQYHSIKSSGTPVNRWSELILFRLAILQPDDTNHANYVVLSNPPEYRLLLVLATRPRNPQYATLLLKLSQFPPAKQTNTKLLDHITTICDFWIAGGTDAVIGEALLEDLYTAGGKTFHSPRILRYMCRCLYITERWAEAKLCFESYLQIALRAIRTKPSVDIDPAEVIVDTIAFAIRMFAERNEYKLAQEHTENLLGLLTEWKIEDPKTLSIAHAAQGIGLLAKSRHLPDTVIIEDASAALEASVTEFPSPSGYIELACALAQRRLIPEAISAVREAIRMDSGDVNAYHLLANLLCADEEYEKALAILERILGLSLPDPLTYKYSTMIMALKLSELLIIEKLKGPGAAFEHVSEVVALYHDLFGAVPYTQSDPAIISQELRPATNGSAEHTSIPSIVINDVKQSSLRHGSIASRRSLIPGTGSTGHGFVRRAASLTSLRRHKTPQTSPFTSSPLKPTSSGRPATSDSNISSISECIHARSTKTNSPSLEIDSPPGRPKTIFELRVHRGADSSF